MQTNTNVNNHGCPKCGHTETTQKDVSMSSGGLGRLLDIQSNQFKAVTCNNCGYTEFYAMNNRRDMDFLDLFMN